MSKVIDVILHKNQYETQVFFVLDRLPDLKYEAKVLSGKRVLIANDGIFSGLYYYNKDRYAQAFAGREFKIPMKDGSFTEAKGQWWHGSTTGNTVGVGIGTPEGLGKCNVFRHIEIDAEVYNNVLRDCKSPSNNYRKYDKSFSKYCAYGRHRIFSKWDVVEDPKAKRYISRYCFNHRLLGKAEL